MPPHDNSRNTILFVVIAAIMLLGYSYFVMQPQAEKRRAAQQAAAEQTTESPITTPSPSAAIFTTDRTAAMATSVRVPIETPKLRGSLSLNTLLAFRARIRPGA